MWQTFSVHLGSAFILKMLNHRPAPVYVNIHNQFNSKKICAHQVAGCWGWSRGLSCSSPDWNIKHIENGLTAPVLRIGSSAFQHPHWLSHLVLQVLENFSDGLQTQMLFTNLTRHNIGVRTAHAKLFPNCLPFKKVEMPFGLPVFTPCFVYFTLAQFQSYNRGLKRPRLSRGVLKDTAGCCFSLLVSLRPPSRWHWPGALTALSLNLCTVLYSRDYSAPTLF